jgi:nitrilase
MGLTETIHARLHENAVSLARDDLAPLREAARSHGVTVVCGVDEVDDRSSRTTLYNTAVTIGPDGEVMNRHRKVMPTNAERMVWGFGDASGMKVVDTPCGRLGTLICWENYMPQARLCLYGQGVELYVAPTFDDGDAWVASMRHIAREGRCWVLGSGCALHGRDIPDDFPEKDTLFPDTDDWLNPGDSVVVAPGGDIVEGPLRGTYGTLYAEVDPGVVAKARRAFDVAGHYARPDIFQLYVNDEAQTPLHFESERRPD